VLAGLAGGDDRDRMPVIRRADLDSIDVGPAQELTIVDIGIAAAIAAVAATIPVAPLDQPLRRLPPADLALPVTRALAVDVADGDDLHPIVFEERSDVIEPLVARADDPQRDAVARGDRPGKAQDLAGDDRREGDPRGAGPCGLPQELTAGTARSLAIG